jgi:hypothetical protein
LQKTSAKPKVPPAALDRVAAVLIDVARRLQDEVPHRPNKRRKAAAS